MSRGFNWPARITLAVLFFTWGTVSVLIRTVTPHFKVAFDLSYRDALLLQFAFFLAYLVLSRTAGRITARMGFRSACMLGLMLMAAGSASLALSTLTHQFLALLPSIFILASGVTFLQVAANPLAAAMGGSRSAASNLTFVQGFNALGTVAAPFIASIAFLGSLQVGDIMDLSPIRNLMLGVAMALLALCLIARKAFSAQPITEAPPEAGGVGPLDAYARRRLVAGTMAIFAYVGAEVSIAAVLINLLEEDGILSLTRNQSGPLTALFWGGALVGRFLGAPILMHAPRGQVLAAAALIAMGLSLVGLFGAGVVAGACLLAIGLFNAIQFPTIFAIASSDLEPPARAKASGWLCTGIIGGGLLPLVLGAIADSADLQTALIVPAVCYAYVAIFGWRYGDQGAAATRRNAAASPSRAM
ncbi:MFS transporter [Brevundimonas diminuta]|jgi:FHS family L-fucose permease-like MFS transporter|uniref:MFS transporter n=1 Tax=Brevundimonas diminuta TaxID=293 RepID=UPI0035D83CA5